VNGVDGYVRLFSGANDAATRQVIITYVRATIIVRS
tara:strand:- start:311 stop:418 length:108 start_codon:yes stop_codon:yes gene_type:complete